MCRHREENVIWAYLYAPRYCEEEERDRLENYRLHQPPLFAKFESETTLDS